MVVENGVICILGKHGELYHIKGSYILKEYKEFVYFYRNDRLLAQFNYDNGLLTHYDYVEKLIKIPLVLLEDVFTSYEIENINNQLRRVI